MSTYARDTTVSIEKSRAEIERTLMRYGASSFMAGTSGEISLVAFEACHRRVKFVLTHPDKDAKRFTHNGRGVRRTPEQAAKAWDQAVRSQWRALCLCVKAKLEAVASGITTFETEFLAHIVLPTGATVAETAVPAIRAAYEGKSLPPLLGYEPKRT